MSTKAGGRWLRMFSAIAIAGAAFGALTARPAQAGPEPYLGWDFGNGLGIGIGTPPSAYDPCPTYGWPVYPYGCRYRYYQPVHHYRGDRRYHHDRRNRY
jgi:hypothetical protein